MSFAIRLIVVCGIPTHFCVHTKKPDEQYELYDPWEKSEYDFYAQIIEFYEQDKSREVKCYTNGPKCDSESDAEDDRWLILILNVTHLLIHLFLQQMCLLRCCKHLYISYYSQYKQ